MLDYSCSAQTLSTLGLMSSGPLALFVLVLVSCLLTWLVLMVGVVAGVAGIVGGVARG